MNAKTAKKLVNLINYLYKANSAYVRSPDVSREDHPIKGGYTVVVGETEFVYEEQCEAYINSIKIFIDK